MGVDIEKSTPARVLSGNDLLGTEDQVQSDKLIISNRMWDVKNQIVDDNRNCDINEFESVRNILQELADRKVLNLELEKAYRELKFFKKANRVHFCSDYVEFQVDRVTERQRIVKARFCRDRLCASCAWRRSRKIFWENRECFKSLGKGRFVFLTLTCRNVSGKRLKEEIEAYLKGFGKLIKRKIVKLNVFGIIRALEVTYNKKEDMYHPHIHCLFHVSSEYFRKGYIKQTEWRKMWREIMELDYDPQVYVKAFKIQGNDMGRELAEVSKYCVKFSDITGLPDKKFAEVVDIIGTAIHGKRLVSYIGTFKEARSQLRMTDDSEELIEALEDVKENDSEDDSEDSFEDDRIVYWWDFKKSRYERFGDEEESEVQ